MLHLKMASFKHHLFYKKHQYPGILLLHGNRLNHTAAYPSQSICANKNLAQFNAIYDYISFYMQTPTKYFQRSLQVHDLTIKSYCHKAKKPDSKGADLGLKELTRSDRN